MDLAQLASKLFPTPLRICNVGKEALLCQLISPDFDPIDSDVCVSSPIQQTNNNKNN
jgi:hypothetical protein